MAIVKVDAVSKFGVKVDNQWINWSKYYKPLECKKGDFLDVSFDSKGYIVQAELVSPDSKVLVDEKITKARDILKGQCLNIVFQRLEGNIKSPEWRKEAYDLAVVLFAELQNAGYLRW